MVVSEFLAGRERGGQGKQDGAGDEDRAEASVVGDHPEDRWTGKESEGVHRHDGGEAG